MVVYSFIAGFILLICSLNEKYWVISQLFAYSILVLGFCGFLYYFAFHHSTLQLSVNFLIFRLLLSVGVILMFPRTSIVRPLFLDTDGSKMARWTMIIIPLSIMCASGLLYYLDILTPSPLNWTVIMDGFILAVVFSLMIIFSLIIVKSDIKEKENIEEIKFNVTFYERLIETMDEYVLVINKNNQLDYGNQQFLSKCVNDFKSFDMFLDIFENEIFETKITLKSVFVESKSVILSDGSNINLSGWMTPFIQDGKFDGMVVTLMNVSEESMSVLKASIEEKNILLAEVHHRVKNNMQIINSLLSLESNKYKESNDIKVLVKKIQGRIRTMALMHEDLYQNLDFTSINIKSYLNLLVGDIKETYSTKRILFMVDCVNTSFDIDTILPLGLIINETCINAVKYAFPNEIKNPLIAIALQDHGDDNYELLIRDNGIGIEKNNQNTLTGFGSTLVDALTMQLEGNISYKVNNGTKITVKFSAKHY